MAEAPEAAEPAAKRQRTAGDADGTAALFAAMPAQPSDGDAADVIPPGPAQHASAVPALSWVLQMPPDPAKFNVEAALALGVPQA